MGFKICCQVSKFDVKLGVVVKNFKITAGRTIYGFSSKTLRKKPRINTPPQYSEVPVPVPVSPGAGAESAPAPALRGMEICFNWFILLTPFFVDKIENLPPFFSNNAR